MNNAVFMYDETPEDELTDIPEDVLEDISDDDLDNNIKLDLAVFSLLNNIFTEQNTDKKLVDLFINPTSDDGVEYGDVIITHTLDTYDDDAEYRDRIDKSADYVDDMKYISNYVLDYSKPSEYYDDPTYMFDDDDGVFYKIGNVDKNLDDMHDYIITAKDDSFEVRFVAFYYELELIRIKTIFSNLPDGEISHELAGIEIRNGHKRLPVYVCYLYVDDLEDETEYEVAIAGVNKLITDIETHEVYCKLNETLVTEFDLVYRSRNLSLIKEPCPCCSE